MVIRLTGLAGSGKTTVGRHLYALWKPEAPNTVLVDGNDIRRILGGEEDERDFTLEGRRDPVLFPAAGAQESRPPGSPNATGV